MSTEAELLALDPTVVRLFNPHAKIRMDKKRSYGESSWYVPQSAIVQAMKLIGGTVEAIGVPGMSATINRVVPLRHPEFPFLLAEGVSAEAMGHNYDTTGAGFYTGWKVSVNFATPDYDITGPDAFLTISTRPSGRSVAVPPSALALAGGGNPADSTVFIPGYTYSVSISKLPYFDNAFYQGVVKTVNDATWRGTPPGTVLFNGPSANRTSTIAGVTTYDVTLDFEVSAISWNKTFAADGSLVDVTFSGSGLPQYTPVSFATLFPILT